MIPGKLFEQVDNTIPRNQVNDPQDFPTVVIEIREYQEKLPRPEANQTNQPATPARRDRVRLHEEHCKEPWEETFRPNESSDDNHWAQALNRKDELLYRDVLAQIENQFFQ